MCLNRSIWWSQWDPCGLNDRQTRLKTLLLPPPLVDGINKESDNALNFNLYEAIYIYIYITKSISTYIEANETVYHIYCRRFLLTA